MHYSSSNTITENTISDNTEFGIFVLLSADNIISKNLISNSDQGIYLFSASSTSSSNNLIFHNDFINNIQHAIDTDDNNIWDDGYPSGGNYWSNYTGSDNFSGPTQDEPGSDGIGDIPYNISDGGSQDRYPKMIPYSLIVDAFGPYAGIVNIPIQFNSSTLGGVPPYNWLWDFGDNTTSTDQKPTHIYNNPGEYIVKLTVTDSKNRSNGDTAQVTIKYMKVKTNGPYTGAVNVPIPFTGSISGGVLPYNWLWDFGDGNTNDEQNTTHTYTAKGNYTVTLTVIDDKGYTEIDTTSANVLLSTVWVDDDFNNLTEGWGYDHFAAVQDGINAVDPRGTIYVFNGTYYENVVISKTVNLIGENINNTIIDGSSQGDVISISADRVSISGFTIQNGQNNIFWGDMYIEMSYPTDYISPYVGGDGNGIEITSDYTRISGNILKNNDLAIKLNTGSSNTVSENILVNNTKAIDLSDSPYNKLINNTIDSYGITITSNDLRYWNTHTIKNNYVNGKPIYYFKNNNEGIVSSDAAQVILANCSNYIIQNNTISNVERGIQLFSSSYTTIYQNTITDLSWCGIYLIKSSNNNISKNILTSSIQGVYVYDSSNNEITKNNISNHSSYGIYLLFRSNNNILSDNKLTNNNYGMYLSSSHENDVTKNSITDQTSYGIYFSSSTHNSINENLIIRNSYGIYLTGSSYLNNISKNNIQNGNYGISLYSSSDNDITKNNIKNHISYGMYLTDSYYSNIYHNNFINNTQQAYDEFMNFWYNVISLVGNYWDDYNGSDSNNDGIGDTPYNISGGSNQDMYPLMRIYDMEREKATPGFELILMICGIALVLFWKRKRMN